jgi:CRISPR type III-B/RAMP module-associated protein Cmr3
MTVDRKTWVIDPRDPLVFGTGAPPTSFVARAGALPSPNTVAGMVRARFVASGSYVSPARAAELLERISIRGPWLRGPVASGAKEHWIPAPHDGVRACDAFVPAKVDEPTHGEGVLWPDSNPDDLWLVHLPERGPDGSKVAPIAANTPLWPLGAAVRWALGEAVTPAQVAPLQHGADPASIVAREHRVHVAIDNRTGTAQPGALFSSPGMRFERDFEIAIDVTAHDESDAAPPGAVVLGGESRLSFRRVDVGATFPAFEAYEPQYANALARTPRGLRVQLLTPACLQHDVEPGTPAWRPAPPVAGLELVAACIPGQSAISGWDLQAADGRGAPRAVRRLVPVGSVYYYVFPELGGEALSRALLAACRQLWGCPITPDRPRTPGEEEQHLALPARDGFGLALPGFWFKGDIE